MVEDIKRTVRIITKQRITTAAKNVDELPMRRWSIELYLLDEDGTIKPATCFSKVVYSLHPSFVNQIQTFHTAPFRCEEDGWGEFEMTIDCFTSEKGGKQTLHHDLNFLKEEYPHDIEVRFKSANQNLINILRETGPVPGDENGARKKGDGEKKRKKVAGTVDMEKLAEGLVKLGEDDLLHVVQLIHDNKSEDTYTKNDIEQGEFHVDLYTLPETLLKMLWDVVSKS